MVLKCGGVDDVVQIEALYCPILVKKPETGSVLLAQCTGPAVGGIYVKRDPLFTVSRMDCCL